MFTPFKASQRLLILSPIEEIYGGVTVLFGDYRSTPNPNYVIFSVSGF